MTTSEIPVAIATGITSKSFTDSSVELGNTYLYSIGAVKNGVEKIGDEISVFASNSDVYFDFNDLLVISSINKYPQDQSLNSRTFTMVSPSAKKDEPYFINGLEDRNLMKHISVPTGLDTTNYSLNKRQLSAALLTSDFTLEIVVNILEYPIRNSALFLMGSGWGAGNGFLVGIDLTGRINLYPMNSGAFTNPVSEGPVISLNQFHHICIQRKSGIFYLYVDGLLVQTQSSNTSLSLSSSICYINSSDNYRSINACIANVRITTAVRYELSGFVSSIDEMTIEDALYSQTKMLLSSNGALIVENASTQSTSISIQNVSHVPTVSIHGNGRFISPSTTNNPAEVNLPALGILDFTLEFFLQFISKENNKTVRLVQIGDSGAVSGSLVFAYGPTGNLILSIRRGSVFVDLVVKNEPDVISNNHYCIQRNSGAYYVYKNGILIGSSVNAVTDNITATKLYLMGSASNVESLHGVLNGFRLTRGIVRYALNGFIPPDKSFPNF